MISAISALAQKSNTAIAAPIQNSTLKNFESTLQSVRDLSPVKPGLGLSGLDANLDLQVLQNQILAGKEFAPAELLRYQIVLSKFSLNVELVSKLAESLLASVRKLQNPQ